MQLKMKQLRMEAGLSQAELASKTGISLGTYRNWERGTNAITLEGAWVIADVLRCSLDELAGRKKYVSKYVEYVDKRQEEINTLYQVLDESTKGIAYASMKGIAEASLQHDGSREEIYNNMRKLA